MSNVAALLLLLTLLCLSTPLYADSVSSENESPVAHVSSFKWYSLVKPIGIATLVLLLITASAGFFMRKRPRFLHKWHKRLAAITILAAFCHALLVFLLF